MRIYRYAIQQSGNPLPEMLRGFADAGASASPVRTAAARARAASAAVSASQRHS